MTERPLPPHLHLDTLAVRTAVDKSQYGENSEALYLSSGFVQPDSETAARRFAGEEDGYIYSRFTNPTVASMEMRLAALEGSQACVGTASGMAAVLLLCMSLLKSGDHVVCSHSVFGSTHKLLSTEFAKFGVQTTFVSQTDLSEWAKAIQANTRLLFAETPTNPLTEVCDIAALAQIARKAGAVLAVDNCFCTPALQTPISLGADVVVHSGTKYLDGQGRVVAGALCASQAMVKEKFIPVMRSAGMSLSPFNAWVVLKGLETLSLRMKAQSAQALSLAQWLENHPKVAKGVFPRFAQPPSTCAGHGAAVWCGWTGLGFRCRRGLCGALPRQCVHRDRQHPTDVHHCQFGRCENHHHPPRQHLAWPFKRSQSTTGGHSAKFGAYRGWVGTS